MSNEELILLAEKKEAAMKEADRQRFEALTHEQQERALKLREEQQLKLQRTLELARRAITER